MERGEGQMGNVGHLDHPGLRVAKRHRIQFPSADVRELRQDEVYFYLWNGDVKEKIRLHDYGRIYKFPGLYEQVVYERLN